MNISHRRAKMLSSVYIVRVGCNRPDIQLHLTLT